MSGADDLARASEGSRHWRVALYDPADGQSHTSKG